mgnify:FL=1
MGSRTVSPLDPPGPSGPSGPSLGTLGRDPRDPRHADAQLATLIDKLADAATAQAARNAAADESFEPLLRLQPESKALKALVRSDKGRARARRALAHVLATNVGREEIGSYKIRNAAPQAP